MKKKLSLAVLIAFLFASKSGLDAQENANAALCTKSVVGYWHSFDNKISTVIKLRDVPCSYNVVDIAFLEGLSPTDAEVVFRLDTVYVEKEKDFIEDVKILKARGQKVIASIGGAAGSVSIPDEAAKNKFVSTVCALIDKYGFEGLDLDIETGVTLGSDKDFKNPTTPIVKYLIAACKEIKAKYGSNFWITMAPEVAYVQGALVDFGSIWGAYLPIIYGLRDELTMLHVQYYNTAGNPGTDGNTYAPATPDFIVAMTDMLLTGFKIKNGLQFPALRQDQVAFGLPATDGAGGGVMSTGAITQALNYLTKGTSFGGQYKLNGSYPSLRGIMTWSVNWDKKAGYGFSNAMSQYFCGSTNLCSPTTDVKDANAAKQIVLYPNPANDVIRFNNTKAYESIEIYNSSGIKLKSLHPFSGSEIEIRELPVGVYFVRLTDKNEVFKTSFVKY